jgi:hypothetical protein
MKKTIPVGLFAAGLIVALAIGSAAHAAPSIAPAVEPGTVATLIDHDPRCAPAPRCRRQMVAVCMHRANPTWTGGRRCCSRWKCSPGPF